MTKNNRDRNRLTDMCKRLVQIIITALLRAVWYNLKIIYKNYMR